MSTNLRRRCICSIPLEKAPPRRRRLTCGQEFAIKVVLMFLVPANVAAGLPGLFDALAGVESETIWIFDWWWLLPKMIFS